MAGLEVWWSAKEAGSRVRLDPETIRNWGRSGKVATREVANKRHRREFKASEVLESAGVVVAQVETSVSGDSAALRERNTILEEVLRRYRLIDEQRDQIDAWHRDIEELLQGSEPVPNN